MIFVFCCVIDLSNPKKKSFILTTQLKVQVHISK